jgi:hypothetical protein
MRDRSDLGFTGEERANRDIRKGEYKNNTGLKTGHYMRRKMPAFPTPTNVAGVNANRRDPHKSGESPPLQEQEPV